MKMKQFFKKKTYWNKVICRLLVAFVVAGMILPVIPGGAGTVYAETTEPTILATPLESSTTGKKLTTGFYYVQAGTTVTCTNSTNGSNGITIADNATVYIYIPAGSVLTATGGAGNGQYTGGGAGIYVPSTATLIFLGNGTVNATGGCAADGADGKQGGAASRDEDGASDKEGSFTTGSGGKGGVGGAGGGAGIGTKGGSGGNGGSGGAGYTVDKDDQTTGAGGSIGYSGNPSGASMGKVYRAEGVTVNAQGGGAGSGGSGGSAGSNSGPIRWGKPDRGAAGGAGGGGGGGGYAGAAVGTGGTGGSGGGGGAGSGYNWAGYFCGGGGGGGGAGGNGGIGGTKGSDVGLGTLGESDRKTNLDPGSSSGSDGDFWSGGSGGSGAGVYMKSSKGEESWGYGGTGGSGGGRSYNPNTSGSITVISEDTLSKYYQYPVYFDGASENYKQYYYTGRSGNAVTAPSYTVEDNQYFIGWRVKQNGYGFSFNDSAVEAGALLWYDETFYQENDVIGIASDTYGPITLEPIIASSAGNKAVSEILTIDSDVFKNATAYLTYQVETLVNDEREDVGQITLVKDEERYLVSSGSGENRGLYKYTIPSTVPKEEAPAFSVHAKGEDTGATVSAGDAIQISYKEMRVVTCVDGEPSDWPGMITLADEDAPVLAKRDAGTYSYVDLEKNVDVEKEYTIVIDGVDSGHTVSFGETVQIDYSSVQVYTEGNVKVDDVVLQNEEAQVSLPLEYRNGAWSAIQQNNAVSKDELAYTIYINGVKTDYDTVMFDGNSNALEVGVYKTRFITRKDNVATDNMVDDIYLGTQLTQRADVGTYETIHVINLAEDSNALTYYVNSVYGAEEAVTTLGEEVVLDYYTIRYNGGSVHAENVPVDNNIYRKGTEIVLASVGNMSNSGKAFEGWALEGTTYAAGEAVIIDNTMSPIAQWESVVYTITYDLNDSGEDGAEAKAVNPNVSLMSYTVDDTITLKNPTREDCTFVGWTYEERSAGASDENADEDYPELNPVMDLTIPAGHTGDITFVAHWAVHQYNIDVDIQEYDFGTRVEGYNSSTLPEAVTVTVTNRGNQPVTLSSITSTPVDETITQSAFSIVGPGKTTLAVGDTTTFTIRPRADVALGEHQEIVTVNTTKGTEASVNVNFLVGKDTTPPTMTVKVGADSWSEFEESISFADRKKYGQAAAVTINATDAESNMGSVQYYLAKEPLTQAQLEALDDAEWQTYTAQFTITDNKQFILYARAYDTADPANVVWVSTDAFEIDTITPDIIGIKAGIYYGPTTFMVRDVNLDTVTLGGTELTPDTNGVYTLPVEKGVLKKLVATDILGHATTIEVTVNNKIYDISYNANGGVGTMAVDSVESGSSFVLPAARFVAPDSGLEFAHWTIQGDQNNTVYSAGSDYTVTGEVTFVANWKYKEYSISYDLQGGKFAEGVTGPSSYTGVDEAFTIPTPSRLGYDFIGWTWEDQTTPVTDVTIETGSHMDYKFTANWTESTEAKYVVRHWQMKANANAEGVYEYELKEEVEYSDEHAKSVTPKVATYAGFTSPAPITLTLDAKQKPVVDYYYTRNTYQMDVVVNGIIVESVAGVYGSEQSAIVTNAVGYDPLILKGVYDFDGNQVADTSKITLVIEGDCVTALMPAQNIKIVLKREPIEYKITYELDGGVLREENPKSYTVVSEAFGLHAPEKDGYAFAGWTWNGLETPVKDVLVNTSEPCDLHYQANWEPLSASVSQGDYLVSHYQQNLDGTTYTLVESERCYGKLEENVTPPLRNYSGFIAPEEETVTVSAEDTDDVRYFYNRESYTLTWNIGVGVSSISMNPEVVDVDAEKEGIQVYYGMPIEATAVLENGYFSAEFTEDGETATNQMAFTMPARDVNISVTGTPRTYNITYNLAGGSFAVASKKTYNVTESDYAVPLPVKAGYEFDGWTVIADGISADGAVNYTVHTDMCADIILNARWTASESAYTVKHFKKNLSGTEYTLADTENGTATVGTVLTPPVKNYSGYISPATISVTVLANGATEVVYKYDLIECAVEKDTQNADSLEEVQDEIQDKIDEITRVMQEIAATYPDDYESNEEYEYFEGKMKELVALKETISQTQKDLEDIQSDFVDGEMNPALDEVTSDDKAGLQDLVNSIDELLKAEPNYLSEEEKNALLEKRAELTKKLQRIEQLEESILKVEDKIQYLPSLEEVTSDDKQGLQDLADSIDSIIQSPNLTQEEKKELGEKREAIQNKLDKIEEVKTKLNNLQALDDAVNKESVTSNDRDAIENLIRSLQQTLNADENNMTEAEKLDIKNRIFGLQDALNNLEQLQEDLEEIKTQFNNVPEMDNLTTEDRYEIEDLVDEIDILLSDNGDHMTGAEKNALIEKREELLEKLEEIERIQSVIDDVYNTDAAVDIMENVSSEDLDAIEKSQNAINELLQKESGHLTDNQKQALQDTLDSLNAKKEIIEEYAEIINDAEKTANKLLSADQVKETDRDAIEEAKVKLDNLLHISRNANHLSDEEKEALEQQAQEVREKLDRLNAAKNAKDAMDNAYEDAVLPNADEVKTEDFETVEALYEQVQDLLENYGGNMSSQEYAEYEELFDVLQEMYENIIKVKEVIESVETNYPTVPDDENLSSNDIELIDELVQELQEVLENYAGNLTEEQQSDLESKLTVLERKKSILQNTADKLDNIEQVAGQLPEMDIVTSDNKDAMKELISDIENTLSMESGLLSEEDREALKELKQELEDAIEKLEEVAGVLSDIQDSVANVPSADEVKTSDRAVLEQLVADIDQMLAENGAHMTEEEINTLLQTKQELLDTMEALDKITEEVAELQDSVVNVPSVEEVKTSDKATLEQVVENIDQMLTEKGNHLSEEERNALLQLKKELQEKLDAIKVLEQKIEQVLEAAARIPEEKELETDDEETVENAIALIDKFIQDYGTRLSEEELKQLADEKSALEEKLEYIEDLFEDDEEVILGDGNAQNQNAGANGTGSAGTGQENGQVTEQGTLEEDVPIGGAVSEEEGSKEESGKEEGGKAGYTVEIYSGQKLVERITGLTEGEVLDLTTVKDGIYTIVTTNGDHVDTRMLVVEDGESNIDTVKGVGNKETEVHFTEEEYCMAVEGLEQIFEITELQDQMEDIIESGGSCTVRFVIQNPDKSSGMDKMENCAKEEKHKLARVFDFSVAAHIYAPDGKETVIPISDTESLLLTAIPLEEFEKGKAKYYVYRSHEWEKGKGEVVEMLPELVGEEKQNPTMEGFYVDDQCVYIWASKYSLYALAYDDVAAEEPGDIVDEEQEQENRPMWWLLLAILGVLAGGKVYRDYRKNRKETV